MTYDDDINLSLAFLHERKAQGKSTKVDMEYMAAFREWEKVAMAVRSLSYVWDTKRDITRWGYWEEKKALFPEIATAVEELEKIERSITEEINRLEKKYGG